MIEHENAAAPRAIDATIVNADRRVGAFPIFGAGFELLRPQDLARVEVERIDSAKAQVSDVPIHHWIVVAGQIEAVGKLAGAVSHMQRHRIGSAEFGLPFELAGHEIVGADYHALLFLGALPAIYDKEREAMRSEGIRSQVLAHDFLGFPERFAAEVVDAQQHNLGATNASGVITKQVWGARHFAQIELAGFVQVLPCPEHFTGVGIEGMDRTAGAHDEGP